DDTTKNTITLQGASGSTKITGLTAGALSATSLDAVNGTQLYQTNANVANVAGTVANVTNTVNNITNGGGIKYFHANSTLADSSAGGTNSVAIGGAANASANNSVALGSNSVANRANAVSVGAVGSERQIINVANGTNGTDAVNVSQLQAMGANITSGVVTNAFVAYDDSTKGKVTFGGTGATKAVTLTNVANGVANSDAVNVAQLQAMGGAINSSGVVTNAFVAYDDTTKNTITLQGATGSTKITGLTAGALSASSSDAVNGSQLYRTATSVANALGGGSSMGLNGTVSAPSYQLSGGTYADVGSALSGLDGEISSINNNIADTTKYIKVVSNSSAAIATGGEAVAIGGGAYASGLNSLSLGSGARSQFANSVALGANSRVTVANTISVGDVGTERRIMNVANGVLSTDAATLGQLNALQNSLTQKVSAESSGVKSMLLGAVPVTNYIAVSTTITPGLPATTTDNTENAMAIGPGAMAQGAGSVVVGAGSGSFHAGSTVIGSSAVAGAVNATVIGGGATTNNSADNSVVIGYMAAAQGTNALALGSNSVTNATNSVGLGANAVVTTTGTNSMALGSASTVSGVNAVAIGYNSTADRANTVSVGASGSTRQIVNVAAGSQDTDAVNLGQMNTAISAIAGGGAPNAVVYDTSAHTTLTLNKGAGAVTVSNVADGVANNDAVNVEQLKAMGANFTSGVVTNSFVAYDDTSKSKITLGGAGASTPVALTNIAAGQVTSTSKDAVNGSQLYGALSSTAAALGGGSSVTASGSITKPSYTLNGQTYTDVGTALAAAASGGGGVDAVKYDTSAHTSVTLGNAGTPVKLSNVADGVANNDAVNVEQLKAMGANFTSGVVTNSFVAYDDTSKSKITLGGAGSTVPVALTNIAVGQVSSTSKDAINGSQLYGAMSSTAAALGGGSTVSTSGQISKPTYTVGGNSYTGVDSAIGALNAAIATGGNPDGVIYDTPAHDKLTLGGANATTPVTIANVAAATSDDQAVNLKQLKEAGLNVDTSGNVTSSFIAYDNASKNTVTFGGVGSTTPVLLKNVAAGIADSDAVNVGQMHSYVDQQIGGGTANGVAYDDSTKSKVTLGGVGSTTPVTLTNVAAGKAATDAVNYGQFSALENVVANIQPGTGNSTYININPTSGGTAAVATGSDSIAIGNGASASGESAIAIGKNTVTSGDNSVAMGAGASAPNTNAVALGANSTTDRDNSVSVGSAGAERQITNVAAGTQGTDAVNLNQLNSAMGNMSNSINNVDRSAAKGIASASALNIVTPYLPGRTTLNAGVANYRGYQAIGLGVSRWNEKGTINYNLGVSTSGGNSTIVRAGIGIVLGN
ncbi:YadA family autotransporter adhesin, partial [Paraburkholderia phytofirmans]